MLPILPPINILLFYISYGVKVIVIAVVILMIIRLIYNYMDANPFTKQARLIRYFTDSLTDPARRFLLRHNVNPKIAPVMTMLITAFLGFVTLDIFHTLLLRLNNIIVSILERNIVGVIGHLLIGLLAIYMIFIIARVFLSWVVSYYNPVMRFLMNVTEPLLAPLRRTIPPLGPFDLSPLVAIFIVIILQYAISGTILRPVTM
jgi:YggT family protein